MKVILHINYPLTNSNIQGIQVPTYFELFDTILNKFVNKQLKIKQRHQTEQDIATFLQDRKMKLLKISVKRHLCEKSFPLSASRVFERPSTDESSFCSVRHMLHLDFMKYKSGWGKCFFGLLFLFFLFFFCLQR